ncbi:MAG: 6-phosphofructokinase [bacterium]|nr:6-phosphofructokinase [bacterium]
MARRVGLLTSGGDCPGLNAAIRGFGKAALGTHGIETLGFLDGFRGLVENRFVRLESDELSGILTDGGTILGTGRDKPHKMPTNGRSEDRTGDAVNTYQRHGLDCLVCIGGGGTQKNALRLQEAGLNILTLPKTIDNDIAFTEASIGFDTARQIAAEAIDRLHSTATSHQRIIVVEVMGHRAGWLALASGLAGGADVILIPEIPYDVGKVAAAVRERARAGKRYSIVAIAEGAMNADQSEEITGLIEARRTAESKRDRQKLSAKLEAFHRDHTDHTLRLTHQLEEQTGQESRLTILGHLQRGGTPSATDRVLGTRLGTTAAKMAANGETGVMLAVLGDELRPIALSKVAGVKKLVPTDHAWVQAARDVGTCLGD